MVLSERNTGFRLCAVGDLYLADSPFRYGHGVRSKLMRDGTGPLLAAMDSVCGECDAGFANLECVMSDKGRNIFDLASVEIRGAPEHLSVLAQSKFNVFNVANNHIFQHGREAFDDTIAGIQAMGGGTIGIEQGNGTNLHVINHDGFDVGFFGFSMHREQYRPHEPAPYSIQEDPDALIAAAKTIRKNFAGPLICSLHWGYEFMTEVSRTQQQLARALIDAGIAVVLGHHPHTVQGIERYGRGLIAYSLGNFVFDLIEPISLDSIALHITLAESGYVEHETTALRIGGDYLPHPAGVHSKNKLLMRLEKSSAELEQGIAVADEDLARRERAYYGSCRSRSYKYFLGHFWRYNPLYFWQSLLRALGRRFGLIHNP